MCAGDACKGPIGFIEPGDFFDTVVDRWARGEGWRIAGRGARAGAISSGSSSMPPAQLRESKLAPS
eukprot:1943230-Pyramimonas_sp.AAC.1